MNEIEVDARNLLCPLPVIRTQNAIEGLEHGARVVVHCTDPGALYDIPAWCRIHGHRLIAHTEDGNTITITVEVQIAQ